MKPGEFCTSQQTLSPSTFSVSFQPEACRQEEFRQSGGHTVPVCASACRLSLSSPELPCDSFKSKQIPSRVFQRLWLPHWKYRAYLSGEWGDVFPLGCYFWCHRIPSDCVEPCQWRMCLCEKHWWGAFPQEDMYVHLKWMALRGGYSVFFYLACRTERGRLSFLVHSPAVIQCVHAH